MEDTDLHSESSTEEMQGDLLEDSPPSDVSDEPERGTLEDAIRDALETEVIDEDAEPEEAQVAEEAESSQHRGCPCQATMPFVTTVYYMDVVIEKRRFQIVPFYDMMLSGLLGTTDGKVEYQRFGVHTADQKPENSEQRQLQLYNVAAIKTGLGVETVDTYTALCLVLNEIGYLSRASLSDNSARQSFRCRLSNESTFVSAPSDGAGSVVTVQWRDRDTTLAHVRNRAVWICSDAMLSTVVRDDGPDCNHAALFRCGDVRIVVDVLDGGRQLRIEPALEQLKGAGRTYQPIGAMDMVCVVLGDVGPARDAYEAWRSVARLIVQCCHRRREAQ